MLLPVTALYTVIRNYKMKIKNERTKKFLEFTKFKFKFKFNNNGKDIWNLKVFRLFSLFWELKIKFSAREFILIVYVVG